jgi:uncharacterized protein YdaT
MLWQAAAAAGQGEYLNIDQDVSTVYVTTPYDAEILKLNEELNETYVGYGEQAEVRKELQMRQDEHAKGYSSANLVSRALSKSKKAYNNASWDLVDAYETDTTVVAQIAAEALPEEMRDMDAEERVVEVKKLKEKRQKVKIRLAELEAKRSASEAEERKKMSVSGENQLDEAVMKAARKQALQKKFTF